MEHVSFIDQERFSVLLDDQSEYLKGTNEVLIPIIL